jgi:predicted HTH transcriptional regulator
VLWKKRGSSHHCRPEFYWENRPRYYEALDNGRREGENLTKWLEYSAEGLLLTLERAWMRIQKFAGQCGKQKLVLRPKQEQLLQLLHDHKSMTPREIWDAIGISRQGALDLLRPLIKAGLVKRIGTKKSGRYILT